MAIQANSHPVIICLDCGGQVITLKDEAIHCTNCHAHLATHQADGTVVLVRGFDIAPLIRAHKVTVARTGHRAVYVWHNPPVRNYSAKSALPPKAPDSMDAETYRDDAPTWLKRAEDDFMDLLERIKTTVLETFRSGGRVTACLYPEATLSTEGKKQKPVDSGDVRIVIQAHTHAAQDVQGAAVRFMNTKKCARCGAEHDALTFWQYAKPFSVQGQKVTHFGFCPINGQPINLMVGNGHNGTIV